MAACVHFQAFGQSASAFGIAVVRLWQRAKGHRLLEQAGARYWRGVRNQIVCLLGLCWRLCSRPPGAGAFAFENVRTSVEHGARHVTRWQQVKRVFLVCQLEFVIAHASWAYSVLKVTLLGRRDGTTCPKWIVTWPWRIQLDASFHLSSGQGYDSFPSSNRQLHANQQSAGHRAEANWFPACAELRPVVLSVLQGRKHDQLRSVAEVL